MKYMGSKARIAKYILPIILKDRQENQYYVEPFVGGANMIDKVDGLRIGADINKYLIKALKLVRDEPHKIPKTNREYTEEMFNEAKKTELENSIDCFAMFQYSFGSMFKGSWAKNKRGTDYVKECVKNVLVQSEKLKDVELIHSSYQDLIIPNNSIIYCDVPYQGTAKYKGIDEFNYDLFYEWCREKTRQGHKVFISEYNAPDDFECVWELEILSTAGKSNIKKATEKLFTYISN